MYIKRYDSTLFYFNNSRRTRGKKTTSYLKKNLSGIIGKENETPDSFRSTTDVYFFLKPVSENRPLLYLLQNIFTKG